MKITENHKIHYLAHDDSGYSDWHSIKIESWMQIPQNTSEIKFKRIEEIRIFYHKDIANTEVGTFEINFGRNDCHVTYANSLSDFFKRMRTRPYELKRLTKKEYLELREKVFRIFTAYPMADYSKLTPGSEYPG